VIALQHMFETEIFRAQITSVVRQVAGKNNMGRYENSIVKYLQELASENESVLMERELRESPAQRRGIPDALQSVEELTREASRYALAEKRTVLKLADIQKAYEAKFCQVWPFCSALKSSER